MRRITRDDGSSLVIVLIVVSVFGLILAGLMTESSASLKFTNTVAAHEAKVYAADAGVQYGIQQIRQNNETCATPTSSGPAIPDLQIDGRTVTVTCDATVGSTFGSSGFAVITKSTSANSLVLSNAHAKRIGGPVYVSGGIDWGPGLISENGNFYQKAGASSCTLGAAKPVKLTVENPPYNYFCTSAVLPDPPSAPPAIPTAVNPAHTTSGSCRVFRPGRYTSPPDLTGDNYFASGVYYFDFDGAFNVGGKLIGGQKASHEQRALPAPACALTEGPGGTGTGVQFVFGKTSRLYVANHGLVELFARTDPSGTGTPGISFVAVPNVLPNAWVTAGWAANTLSATTDVLDNQNGDTPDLAIHGMVYAPNHSVRLRATNSVHAQTLGGMVVHALEIESSASASNMDISIEPGPPDPREVLVTATAQGTEAGERPVVSSAVVRVDNDAARTVSVRSWRTRGPSD